MSGEKKLVAKVGQRVRVPGWWGMNDGTSVRGDDREATVQEVAQGGNATLRHGSGKLSHVAADLLFGAATLLSDTADAGTVGAGETDWAAYLPKEPLPDTGPKQFKAGQVWAFRDDVNDVRVFRIGPDARTHEVLAAGPERWTRVGFVGGISDGSVVACRAVLICNPGETPPPPEVVFGKPASPHSLDRGEGSLVGSRWGNEAGAFRITHDPWDVSPDMVLMTWDNGIEGAWRREDLVRSYTRLDASPPPSPSLGEVPRNKTPGNVWRYLDNVEDGIHRQCREFTVLAWTGVEGMTTRIRLDNGRERSMGPYLDAVAEHVRFPGVVEDTDATRQAALVARTDKAIRELRLKHGAKLCPGCGEVFDRVGKSGRCFECWRGARRTHDLVHFRIQTPPRTLPPSPPPWTPSDPLCDIPDAGVGVFRVWGRGS